MSQMNSKRQPCEVYSRVVGGLTPVKNWNKGKREEFNERLKYKIGGGKCSAGTSTKPETSENMKG
jgi:hypothetical protein